MTFLSLLMVFSYEDTRPLTRGISFLYLVFFINNYKNLYCNGPLKTVLSYFVLFIASLSTLPPSFFPLFIDEYCGRGEGEDRVSSDGDPVDEGLRFSRPSGHSNKLCLLFSSLFLALFNLYAKRLVDYGVSAFINHSLL